MPNGFTIGAFALAAALSLSLSSARAFDDALYPDWSGGWMRLGGGDYNSSKPRGLGQQAPSTPNTRRFRGQLAARRRRPRGGYSASMPAARHAADDDGDAAVRVRHPPKARISCR